jgi:hypothetical protein
MLLAAHSKLNKIENKNMTFAGVWRGERWLAFMLSFNVDGVG